MEGEIDETQLLRQRYEGFVRMIKERASSDWKMLGAFPYPQLGWQRGAPPMGLENVNILLRLFDAMGLEVRNTKAEVPKFEFRIKKQKT